MEQHIRKLERYLPSGTAAVIADWIVRTECGFRITRRRSSKLGDYRAPYQGHSHRISVNGDLNPYAFLVTTVHEFAHLKTYMMHKGRVKPHGAEWKTNFRQLMSPFFEKQVFPGDIAHAIGRYLDNPAASSCSDLQLFRALQAYDTHKADGSVLVEMIPEGHCFRLPNGRVFRKIKKERKRFRCLELSTRRIYLFSPVAEVFRAQEVYP